MSFTSLLCRPITSTVQYSTLNSLPGSHAFYKYMPILHSNSVPCILGLPQGHRHTALYVTALRHTSTNALPYCTLRHCPGPHFFYKYITELHSTSLPWITHLRQLHPHTALYGLSFGRTTTSTSPYPTLSHPGLHFIYKNITILPYTYITKRI